MVQAECEWVLEQVLVLGVQQLFCCLFLVLGLLNFIVSSQPPGSITLVRFGSREERMPWCFILLAISSSTLPSLSFTDHLSVLSLIKLLIVCPDLGLNSMIVLFWKILQCLWRILRFGLPRQPHLILSILFKCPQGSLRFIPIVSQLRLLALVVLFADHIVTSPTLRPFLVRLDGRTSLGWIELCSPTG